ncbi:hypothetical protein KCP78_25680 [Salmonella enterica subsp. enterica]|nr:hypothetical protein KCP78_25680 [Salmonella enterica subsp. enterica]
MPVCGAGCRWLTGVYSACVNVRVYAHKFRKRRCRCSGQRRAGNARQRRFVATWLQFPSRADSASVELLRLRSPCRQRYAYVPVLNL